MDENEQSTPAPNPEVTPEATPGHSGTYGGSLPPLAGPEGREAVAERGPA